MVKIQWQLELGGHVGGECLNSLGVTALAQDMVVQGIAASALRLRRQHQSTVLQHNEMWALVKQTIGVEFPQLPKQLNFPQYYFWLIKTSKS